MTDWKWRHDRLMADYQRLLKRVEFAALPIGKCVYCGSGTKPGPGHDKRCELYQPSDNPKDWTF